MNYIYIAVSLDGYIATEDHGVDWLNDIPQGEGNLYSFTDFIENIDAIVMGCNTFETVLSFGKWPYTKKVIVLSNALSKVPNHLLNKVELMQGKVENILTTLHNRGYKNLYIDGGNVIQSFLKQDLIDEMIITTVPILLGKGISLFGYLDNPIKLKHIETMVDTNSLVMSRYTIDK